MFRFIPPSLALALAIAACASPSATNYILTTQSPHICCRSLRYAVWPFPATVSAPGGDTGVAVRLVADTLRARCGHDADVDVVIANNGANDIFIPFSHELEAMRVKLYPWRILYENGRPVRLARQLQYNDLVERQDAVLRLFRLPSGRQVRLAATIPSRWLCAPAVRVTEDYLTYEMDPIAYSDRTRPLRGADYTLDPDLKHSATLRYEVVYTSMKFLDALPVTSRTANAAGDTVEIRVAMEQEAGHFLDDSQQIARSNDVPLAIGD